MTAFITEVVSEVLKSEIPLSEKVFIFPGKRAGFFFKRELLRQNQQICFAPKILSIQEFIEEIADVKIVDNATLLFEFYESYLSIASITEKENFESFSSWAPVLLNDFSEIDRNLVSQEQFFSYLKDIKKLEQWHLKSQHSALVENYIRFWNSLAELYENFTSNLLQKELAYQGLAYREAVNNLEHYGSVAVSKKHYFVGFNALSKSEEAIIQQLLDWNCAEAFWDADSFFMNDTKSGASHYLRKIKSTWKYYQNREFKNIRTQFNTDKKIQILGCSKNIGQAKCAGDIVAQLSSEEIKKTVLVLADEALLMPVLYSLPDNVKNINITMGLPLSNLPLTSFFDLFIEIQASGKSGFYYKEVLRILNHPLGKLLLEKSADRIIKEIVSLNYSVVHYGLLEKLTDISEKAHCRLLFEGTALRPDDIISRCKQIILLCSEKYRKSQQHIALETLFKINEVFNSIEFQNKRYGYISENETLHRIFQELTSVTNLDFVGEPHDGLQIMGLLETRLLDFENVILLSANEDILPSGKSNKSFITYDLKLQYGLPLYFERDAVFAYHFFRLLFRAQNIFLLYNNNNESGGMITGEKSRFIMQLQQFKLPAHQIEEVIKTPEFLPSAPTLRTIHKTPEILAEIKKMASEKGFSPSRLADYIRNPLEFYEKHLLHLTDEEEVEETVAANTMGSIVHETLETLYSPFLNQILSPKLLRTTLPQVDKIVLQKFEMFYKNGEIDFGKNLIIVEVAKYFVQSFIKKEAVQLEQNEIVLLELEKKISRELTIPGMDFTVKLRGIADRIDSCNGVKRIIDYKTGRVKPEDLKIKELGLITSDYKYSKAFQVLCYAYMIFGDEDFPPMEAGIISFRNMSSGFMQFNNEVITPEILGQFKTLLFSLIEEICNPDIPFVEKEV